MRHMIALADAKWEIGPYTGKNGMYCAVQPDTLSLLTLVELCNDLGVVSDPRKFHCTVMYSKELAPELPKGLDLTAKGYINHIEWWAGHDEKGYLTASIRSPELESHHAVLKELGAKHSYDSYSAHVTLTSGVKFTGALRRDVIGINNQLSRRPIPVVFDRFSISDVKD